MLHTVNKSPFQTRDMESCLAHLADGCMLLIEDGVYGAVANGETSPSLSEAIAKRQVYALAPDLKARGIDQDKLVEGVRLVDYTGFVELAIEHGTAQAWL